MNHLAILHQRYLDAILAGEKTVESRLSKNRCAPYECVEPGDLIYFKQSSGPVRAAATVASVEYHEDLTPAAVGRLERVHNGSVRGEREYWQLKSEARYATLIWLDDVHEIDDWGQTPIMNGRGWLCLEANHAPPRRRRGAR
jgi:ASC-1-like (ASCH) protein